MTTPRTCPRCRQPVPAGRVRCPCLTARTPCERCGAPKNGGNPLCGRCRAGDAAKAPASRVVCPCCGRGKHAVKPLCWQCRKQLADRESQSLNRAREVVLARPPWWDQRLAELAKRAEAGLDLFGEGE